MKNNKVIKYVFIILLLAGVSLFTKDSWAPSVSTPVLADYTAYPPFVVGSSNKPNVMIIMSNDHTNFYKGYSDTLDLDDDGSVETTYKNSVEYYGYFDPNKCYSYASNTFAPATAAANHYCTSSR
ncbi:MAG: hypothetical protein HZC11_05150, partial [Nitrospirae bacterium]|nr:hypothetical protein [Nitrospirota bacterium]